LPDIGILHFPILLGIGQPESQNTVDDLQCLGAIQRIPTSRHFTLQGINHIEINPRIHTHQNPKKLWRDFGEECGTEGIHLPHLAANKVRSNSLSSTNR